MKFEMTDWFYGTTPPIRPGVYETRHRVPARAPHDIVIGYSNFDGTHWGYTRGSVSQAFWFGSKSTQQNKEWRGFTKEQT